MKFLYTLCLAVLALVPSDVWAVSYLNVNGTSRTTVTRVPQKIVLSSDVASFGNKLACEIFIDVNSNGIIDHSDQRIDFLSICDGIGWIRDPESPENAIPGDETPMDSRIQTTLFTNSEKMPVSSQQMLVRATDEDQSTAIAIIKWKLELVLPIIQGRVLDNDTDEPLPHICVYVAEVDYPDHQFTAITNEKGFYALNLPPGDYLISLNQTFNGKYLPSETRTVELDQGEMKTADFDLHRYRAFIHGFAKLKDGTPVGGVVVTAQNITRSSFQHTMTNDDGSFELGVEKGKNIVSMNPYFSNLLGRGIWPAGYFVDHPADTLVIKEHSQFQRNFVFEKYPSSISGFCLQGGQGIKGVLVQGVFIDPNGKDSYFTQAISAEDGSYKLGVYSGKLTSLIAQKAGLLVSPQTGYSDIQVKDANIARYDFHLAKTKLMSISGKVMIDDTHPVAQANVIAVNDAENSPKGFLFTKTDADGAFKFNIEVPGSWQIGVYKDGVKTIPPMHYKYLSPGMKYTDLVFYLDKLNFTDSMDEGKAKLTSFDLLPNSPNPFNPQTIIKFVLPNEIRTRVEVLSVVGKRVKFLLNDDLSSGYHTLVWDGTDDAGNAMASGVYLCRVKAGEEDATQTIALLR
ncbi:MAG: hypothetical protein GWP06_04690 [Actinobacteria bacterium]|nr:hypothetical protein [Actinomycetota bacterium]